MAAPYILVVALLSIQSSYRQNSEQPRAEVPDTVQFWFTPSKRWRIKTFAIDHDIHTYVVGAEGQERQLTVATAEENTRKHYGDVLESLVIIEIADPTDVGAVTASLKARGLSGKLELGKTGLAFYNPDGGRYRSLSVPE